MPSIRNVTPFVLALVAACGGTTPNDTTSTAQLATAPTTMEAPSPEDVALAFFQAVRADDQEGLLALFTEKAATSVASGDSFQVDGESLGEFEVGSATTDANEAKVPVVAVLDGEEQNMRLLMRRESDEWRIFAFDVSIGGEGWMTFNLETIEDMLQGMVEGMATEMGGALEDAFDDWSQGGSKEEIALARERFDSLRAISADEHRAAWQVDVHATDQPAFELLSTLFDGTGLALDDNPQLAQPITIELMGVSRLEALERICETLDVRPVYPTSVLGGAFSLMAEPFDEWPVDDHVRDRPAHPPRGVRRPVPDRDRGAGRERPDDDRRAVARCTFGRLVLRLPRVPDGDGGAGHDRRDRGP